MIICVIVLRSSNEQSKFQSNEQSKFHHSTSELTSSSRVQHHSTSSSGLKTSHNVTYSTPSPTLNRLQHHNTSSSGMKTSQNVTYSPPSPTLNRVQHHSTSSSGMKTSHNVSYNPSSPTFEALRWDQETPLASVHEEVLAIVTLPRPSDLALLTATAQSPSGGIVSGVQVRRGPHDTAHVSFIPTEVGEYFLDVRVRDSPINGSPFSMHAFDARAIKVGNIPDGQVGQPVKFQSEFS